MNNGTPSSSSDNETKPKVKKSFGINFTAKFDIRMKTRCELIIEADNELFQNRKKTYLCIMFISTIFESKIRQIIFSAAKERNKFH